MIQQDETSQKNKIKYSYFKVCKDILNISNTKDLSKSELLIYLLHCRRVNPKGKHLNCSLAGVNDIKNKFQLEKEAIETAHKNLIKKFFIEEKEKSYTGFYKTTAKKILPFPEYTTNKYNKGTFSKRENYTFNNIQIPSSLIDKGIINAYTERAAIMCILLLFSLINYSKYLGVNYNLIYFYNDERQFTRGKIGGGFNPEISHKYFYEAVPPNRIFVADEIKENFKHSTKIIELIKKWTDLFELVPVLFYKDLEDENIINRKFEIFEAAEIGLSFKDDNRKTKLYRFTLEHNPEMKEENILIHWILRPKKEFIVLNEDSISFFDNREKTMQSMRFYYSSYWFITDIKKQIELFNTTEFWDFYYSFYDPKNIYEELSEENENLKQAGSFLNFYDEYKFKDKYFENSVLPLIDESIKMHYYYHNQKCNS